MNQRREFIDNAPLIIAGASARAAAWSAARGGMRTVCFDLFGDVDLREIADAHVVGNLKRQLVAAVRHRPTACWLYTGALENHPRIVAAISRRHRLLGNPPEVLREIRDPFRVFDALKSAGLDPLDVRNSDAPPPRDGQWLVKPIRSAAGRGIAVWNDAGDASIPNEPHYFQQQFVGTPVSAVLIAGGLSCRLLGITRQLVGEAELHAGLFSYCGSIGPLPLTPALRGRIEAIGKRLAAECRLRGLFGLDLLIDRSRVRLVEVNPRYPASAEVLEYALGLPMLPLHVAACESFETDFHVELAEAERTIAAMAKGVAARDLIVGKAILFADRELIAPRPMMSTTEIPTIADVPAEGTRIHAGEPICTVFATGANVTQCLNRLFETCREKRSDLSGRR